MRFWEPHCPVDARMKVWIEVRLAWLAEQLGTDRLFRTPILSPAQPDFFGAARRQLSVRDVLERICQTLQLDPRQIRLQFDPDHELPAAAARAEFHGGDVQLSVAESRRHDFQSLVAALVHELARCRLQQDRVLVGVEHDEELLVELSTVLFGYGIFAANVVIQEANEQIGGNFQWWMGRQGHLTARDYGYALALLAWLRGERKPAWQRDLRLDARVSLRQSLRYLYRTDDTLLGRSGQTMYGKRSVSALVTDMTEGSDGARLAALWELRERAERPALLIPPATALLCHPHSQVRAEAAWAVAAFGADARSAVPELLQRLRDDSAEVRSSAIAALREVDADPHDVLPAVGAMLGDPHPQVVKEAVLSLHEFGALAEQFVANLLRVLSIALVQCNFELSEEALLAITNATDDYGARIAGYFENDAELLRQVLDILQRQQEQV